MSYEDRKKASLGKDKMMYCPTCMCDREVYSGAGHKVDEMNLHCLNCTHFVARLLKNYKGEWELDTTIYG